MEETEQRMPSFELDLGTKSPTGFNLGNLESLKSGNEEKKEEFNWETEFQKINQQAVTRLGITQEVDKHTCLGVLETLEGEKYSIECSMAKGISLLNDAGEHEGQVYDSLEGLLMRVSQLYVQTVTERRENDEE